MTTIERPDAATIHARPAPIHLLHPLAKFLLPTYRQMNKDGVPKDRRSVSLPKEDWPKQFKGEINKCLGITIRWV